MCLNMVPSHKVDPEPNTWKRGCTLDPPQPTIPPSGGTRMLHKHKYHLDVGTETVVYFSNPVAMGKFSQFRNPLQHVSFFGKCYQCKYAAHSQKYCPLRYCKLCKSYGHSEMVCWKRNSMTDEVNPALKACINASEIAEVAASDAAAAAAAAAEAVDQAAVDPEAPNAQLFTDRLSLPESSE